MNVSYVVRHSRGSNPCQHWSVDLQASTLPVAPHEYSGNETEIDQIERYLAFRCVKSSLRCVVVKPEILIHSSLTHITFAICCLFNCCHFVVYKASMFLQLFLVHVLQNGTQISNWTSRVVLATLKTRDSWGQKYGPTTGHLLDSLTVLVIVNKLIKYVFIVIYY